MVDIIGQRAYKTVGYFAGLIGIVQSCDVTPYKLVFSDGSSVGVFEHDLQFVEEAP
jgi:hypothetical protein